MKKIVAFLLVAALCLVMICSCGKKEETPTGGESGALPLNVSVQYAVQQCIPWYMAKDQGLFDKYGVDVQNASWYSAGAPQLEAQPGGEWDIGLIGFTAAITAALKYDMEVIGMCGFDQGDCCITNIDSEIYQEGNGHIDGYPGIYGSAETWAGKKIIVTLGTTRDVFLRSVLGTMGLTYDDVTILNMDNESGKTAFETGEGDIWLPTSTDGAKMLAADPNRVCVASVRDVDGALFNCIVAPKDYLEKNEDVAVSYIAALIEACLWSYGDTNFEKKSEYYSEVMKNYMGVEYTKEECDACIRICDFADRTLFENLCKDDGALFKEYCGKFFDMHALVGIADAANRDAFLSFCNTTYLEKALELYKTTNNVQ